MDGLAAGTASYSVHRASIGLQIDDRRVRVDAGQGASNSGVDIILAWKELGAMHTMAAVGD